MSGSSGIISKTIMTPTSGHQEQIRNTEAGVSSFPGLHEGVRNVFGTISKVHPERPLVKAYDDQGADIANQKWIPINYSSMEIAEKFGTVRIGMRVLVFYVGPDGSGASAFIVGKEGERNLNQPLTINDADRSMYLAFAPGKGIG